MDGNRVIECPQYTAEQYLNSTEPYEFLYAMRNNKFLMQQMVQRMKAHAGSVGVRCFVQLFESYCEYMRQQDGVIVANSTQFDDQEIELFSGEYLCNELGVSVLDRFGFEQNICRHPIMPVQRLCNADNGEERLKIAYKKGKAWRSIIVEKSVIASSNKILDLAAHGILVNSENAKALSTYLLEIENLNFETIPEQKSIGRLGWVGEGQFSPYVEELVFDGETNFKHIFNAVRPAGSREKWLEAMRSVRAERGVARLFLAASFASAILEPCGLLPFFVHAFGGQGTGKTVSLMVAASVWANPKMGEYITTFNSTDVGQEMVASCLNSLPFCMDELQIQAASGVKDFDKTIYKLTEGIGKTRGAKTGGIKKVSTWKNCILTTGEYPIINSNSMGGATVRVIEFECTEKVYSDLVGLCAVLNENYGWAGKEFIDILQKDGMKEYCIELQKWYYHQLLKTDSADKQAASASAILASDAIVTSFMFEDDCALTVEEISAFMTKKKDIDANQRAYDYVNEMIARNSNKFAPVADNYNGELWGKLDEHFAYIIKSVFDREMSNQGFNSTVFLSWAKRKGMLRCDGDRRTKNVRIAGSLANCVCIMRNVNGD